MRTDRAWFFEEVLANQTGVTAGGGVNAQRTVRRTNDAVLFRAPTRTVASNSGGRCISRARGTGRRAIARERPLL